MAEPIGLVASIITIAGVAYQSSKLLYEFIEDFRNASQSLNDLHTDLSTVQQLLHSLTENLENTNDADLSDGFRICLQDLKPSVEACSKACIGFRTKVSKITSHSTEGHVSWRDKARLQFEEKGIMAFKYRLESHKSTINIALSLMILKSSDENRQAVEDLEKNITTAVIGISGQIQGLEMSLSISEVKKGATYNTAVTEALKEHELALKQCLRVCTSAVDAAPTSAGDTVKHLKAYDFAKQMVAGTIGNAEERAQPITVGVASASGNSHQAMVQNVGENAVAALMSNFFSTPAASKS
ncbi:hypothetical protein BDV95DRAFT_598219 [Massariosphaeria phaeospora]|uniref:Azaphilone pigments biosynthesis cluster protein L N-terminal domain-containing protein n=1 Tax=Massariosphaeria phaeospora TaxID=100035 RepID=A0A7C8M3A9_9PLEO|nr:hypothetical protein BDV95DRAFT_598219 [Massariosphaeria phaeospora]